MKHFAFYLPLALLLTYAQAAEPTQAATSLSLNRVMEIANEKNPDIVAARESWKSKKALVKGAAAWPNPVLSYMDEKEPSGMEGVEPMRMRTYSVQQDIPFPGKLSAESRMQHHEALIAEAGFRDKQFEVLKDVRLRYYELYMTDRRIDLAKESVAILQSSLQSAQNRLARAPRTRSQRPPNFSGINSNDGMSSSPSGASAGGGISAADVFMVQTELRKMENMLFEEQQQRRLMEIELNTLLNQSIESLWGPVEAPELADIPVTLAELQNLARNNAPIYLSAEHERRHSDAMLARSRLDFAPDFGVLYGKKVADEGPDGQKIEAMMSVPLWFRRPAGRYESAKAHFLEAEANSQVMKNMVTKMVNMEFIETQTHLKLSRSYLEGILPPAKSNLEISRQRYATGQVDFLRFLEAFRTWIDAHNRFEEQLYHYGEHWSELERWSGVDLTQAKSETKKNLKPEEKSHEH